MIYIILFLKKKYFILKKIRQIKGHNRGLTNNIQQKTLPFPKIYTY